MTEAPQLRLELPAKPENVIVVRQAVAGLGEAVGLGEQRVNDMKTVVTEACNNVVVHAYDGDHGPLEVTAAAGDNDIEVAVSDRGRGFQPRAAADEPSLGLGLPLIASLSDSFSIQGGAGSGTRISARFDLAESTPGDDNGTVLALDSELEMKIAPGALVRPVLARVIGALAARADFSFERLSDTVLLGDAVSAHEPGDFSGGQLGISMTDAEGVLTVKVGPLVPGGGQRLIEQMKVPGESAGSLEALARSMEVRKEATREDADAEFLVFEVEGS
jgi:serine/threonine-protein kinase RsbW